MGAVFGVGLLEILPTMSTEEQIATMTRFAELCGATTALREVVGERVGEWQPPVTPNGGYTLRWLEPAEAAPILKFAEWEQRSAPYSQFSFLDGWQIFIPGAYRPKTQIELPLPNDEPETLQINTLEEGIAELESINRRIKTYEAEFWEGMRFTCEEYVDFHDSLRKAMEGCIEHGLIYRL